MNILLITIFAVASLSVFPTRIYGSTTEAEDETPKALPITSQLSSTKDKSQQKPIDEIKTQDNLAELNRVGEIWQENDHEVLIRNERGANKNNKDGAGGGAAGKKGKNKQNKNENKQNMQTNTQLQSLQQQQQTKQHQQQHSDNTQTQNHKNKKNNNKNFDNTKIQDQSSCRYLKSPWTECDAKSNTRSRTLTLKKGEEGCVPTRTIQKKCKKACRYEKGAWSECTTGQMSRTDKLKSTSDATCQSIRVVNKNCNPAKAKGENNKNKEQRAGKNGNKEKANRNKSRA